MFIGHILNAGEYKIENSRYRVDGYHEESKTCYEFNGCLWHGCPKCFNPEDINSVTNSTFQSLYDKTMKKETYIRSLNYKLITIWECEWNRIKS